jgi:DNA-binding transcriptional regulator LsrR (DeoR family)
VHEVARRIADRLGAQVRFLHAPGVVDTPEMKKALLSDSSIAAATKHWRHLEGALLGVGGGPTSHPGYGTVMDRLDDGSRRGLASMEIVGDIGGHFFRLDGEFSEEGWSDRTVAIPVPDLRRTPRAIAIAAGPNKVSAILGALRTRVAHVLITDTPTAEGVMRLADRLPVAAA